MTDGDRTSPVSIVLVAPGRRLLLETLGRVIRLQHASTIRILAGPIETADGAIAACRRRRPDLVVLDADGDAPSGTLDLIERIKRTVPTKVLLILASPDDRELFILDFIEAGADAFLDRSLALDEVVRSIRAAAEGDLVLPDSEVVGVLHRAARERDAMRRALELTRSLTQRETEVLQLMAHALTNDAIAAELHVSGHTVATHVQNLYRKMGVHSRLEAVAIATRVGIASLEEPDGSEDAVVALEADARP